MTPQHLKATFARYRQWLITERKAVPRESEPGLHPDHLAWMCQEATEKLIPAGKLDKAMRWLGYIQGVLRSFTCFSLSELREHSRPPEGSPTPDGRKVRLDYTNWKGVRRTRVVEPVGFAFSAGDEWHPEPQWLMYARDCEDGGKVKGFALSGIHGWRYL